ncbi:MAG: hypothetical protein ACPL25_07460 [Ignavibacteria bacterium]
MFDREKQIVINRYSQAIFHETEKISVSDLLTLNIPESIKHYIRLEIEKRVENEFREIRKFSKFNYDHIKVKPLVDDLKVLLTLTKELDNNELSILLKFALDLNMDYLLKPCDTLTSFVIRYEEFQPLSVVMERLNYVIEYEYIPLLVKKYFEKTAISKISKGDFLGLLYKIDKEYTKDFTILEHYNLFSRFRNFLNELNLAITDIAEYEAFVIYLKDKQQINLVEFLEENRERFRAFGGSIFSFLQSILHSSIFERKGGEKKSQYKEQQEPVKVESEKIEPEKRYIEKIEEEFLSDSSTDVNSINQIEKSQDDVEVENSRISDKVSLNKVENDFQEVEEIEKSDLVQKRFSRNLDGLMPARLQKKIIKKIFDNNEFDFVEFMGRLNTVNNWDEASLLLTDLFDKKNIHPFSKWAIKFTEFLYENIK